MAPDLFELVERPRLVDPALVVALDGWVDAGAASATALATLLDAIGPLSTVAIFDADALVDHRSRRPILHLVEGVSAGLSWPTIELRRGRDADGRDALVLLGAEPDYRWQAFSRAVAELASDLGATLAVGFGAYPAPVPHTRPSLLAVTASDDALAARAGQVRGTLDVPAGASAAVERAFADAGLAAVGLWAQVPHYASAMPYPAAALALLDGLAALTGLTVERGALREAASATRAQIDELIARSDEHTQLVAQLEARFDADAAPTGLPSGDELAAELERYLREREQ